MKVRIGQQNQRERRGPAKSANIGAQVSIRRCRRPGRARWARGRSPRRPGLNLLVPRCTQAPSSLSADQHPLKGGGGGRNSVLENAASLGRHGRRRLPTTTTVGRANRSKPDPVRQRQPGWPHRAELVRNTTGLPAARIDLRVSPRRTGSSAAPSCTTPHSGSYRSAPDGRPAKRRQAEGGPAPAAAVIRLAPRGRGADGLARTRPPRSLARDAASSPRPVGGGTGGAGLAGTVSGRPARSLAGQRSEVALRGGGKPGQAQVAEGVRASGVARPQPGGASPHQSARARKHRGGLRRLRWPGKVAGCRRRH